MMRAIVIAGVVLVELHGPHGQRIFLNPSEVVAVREPRIGHEGHFAEGAHCLVILANGQFISVREHCDEVRRKLENQ